jgi:hypothetical protein
MSSNSREEEAEQVGSYLIKKKNFKNQYLKSKIDKYEGQKDI